MDLPVEFWAKCHTTLYFTNIFKSNSSLVFTSHDTIAYIDRVSYFSSIPKNMFQVLPCKIRNKIVFNYCQTSVLFFYKGATLVDNRAHGHYTLVGSPAWGPVLNPLVAFTSTTVYILLLTVVFHLSKESNDGTKNKNKQNFVGGCGVSVVVSFFRHPFLCPWQQQWSSQQNGTTSRPFLLSLYGLSLYPQSQSLQQSSDIF